VSGFRSGFRYITADGKSGLVVRHMQAAARYCIWYAHWQGLNPAKGAGWSAFTTVVERIHEHLRDQVVWMRPSAITQRYHAADGWDFVSTHESGPAAADESAEAHAAMVEGLR
jgi:hypothetical protein